MKPVATHSQNMRVADIKIELEGGKVGRDMHQLIAELLELI